MNVLGLCSACLCVSLPSQSMNHHTCFSHRCWESQFICHHACLFHGEFYLGSHTFSERSLPVTHFPSPKIQFLTNIPPPKHPETTWHVPVVFYEQNIKKGKKWEREEIVIFSLEVLIASIFINKDKHTLYYFRNCINSLLSLKLTCYGPVESWNRQPSGKTDFCWHWGVRAAPDKF